MFTSVLSQTAENKGKGSVSYYFKQFVLQGRGECRSGEITFMHVYLSLYVESLNNCDSELGPLKIFSIKVTVTIR